MRVAVVDHRFADLEIERRVLTTVGATVIDMRSFDEARVVAECSDVDGILVGPRIRLDEAFFAQLRRCRVIVRYGVGFDNVHVAQATARSIIVANVPDYCVEEVATHAVAMILALNRHLFALDRSVRQGHWELGPAVGMRRLSTCTLGLLGFGRIGEAVGRRARALGLRVLVSDPFRSRKDIEAAGAIPSSLEAILDESDFVSIHAPKEGAQPLLGAIEIAAMKPGACVINVARGGLVDHVELAKALHAGNLGGAAVDVTDPEPPAPNDPILSAPNVIITPHSAWFSAEAAVELRRKAAEEVARVLGGAAPLHAVRAAHQ